MWFVGGHSDVGGSCPETESGLSKIALRWMLREAEAAGLLIDAWPPGCRDRGAGQRTGSQCQDS